ncbi:MAG: prepilin-type N-terminal cleavage/methylation domain-containing protein [Verrucomicrobiota bacterium]
MQSPTSIHPGIAADNDIVNTIVVPRCRLLADRSSGRKAAFSLFELLTVMAIIGILAAFSAPSLLEISNSTGRKGAVNVLMNAFEQARVAALTSGENSYVGFATELSFNANSDYLYRAFIIFRESSAEEQSAGAGPYTALTKWEVLPKNIYFLKNAQTLVGDQNSAPHLLDVQQSLPQVAAGQSIPVIEFNSFGAIQNPKPNSSPIPPDDGKIDIYITETQYDPSNAQLASRGNLLDRITFSRFTGRAQFETAELY